MRVVFYLLKLKRKIKKPQIPDYTGTVISWKGLFENTSIGSEPSKELLEVAVTFSLSSAS